MITEHHYLPEKEEHCLVARISKYELLLEQSGDIIMHAIAKAIAEKFVAENYQEIVAHIDQKAIATLSVADGAAAIRHTLEKKIPDKVLEVVKTEREVYEKGLFGGLRRVR